MTGSVVQGHIYIYTGHEQMIRQLITVTMKRVNRLAQSFFTWLEKGLRGLHVVVIGKVAAASPS